MLAECKKLIAPSGDYAETPLLLPSFSSKGFPELKKIIKAMEEFLYGPVLISAYDVYHDLIQKHLSFPNPILFIDSGGYESSSKVDFLEDENFEYRPRKWTEAFYKKTMRDILRDKNPAKVIVSYDFPYRRVSLEQQIRTAHKTFEIFSRVNPLIREILLKPETNHRQGQFLKIDKIVSKITKLREFEIIGVTEKELGHSLAERMHNIARLRSALREKGMNQFIHVFGSLDTISTPAYFMCGADIFDGLTWLRYGYDNGALVYQRNYWASKFSPDTEDYRAILQTCVSNHDYLKKFVIEMKNFQKTNDFEQFSQNNAILRQLWETLKNKLQGVI